MNKNKSAKQIATTNTLVYRRDHPNGRVSYGISGVPGLAVIDLRLFAGGKAPKSIVLDCELAAPVAKAEAAPAATS